MADLLVTVGADLGAYNAAMQNAGSTASDFAETTANQMRALDATFTGLGSSIKDKLTDSLAVARGNFLLFGDELGANQQKLSAYSTALNSTLALGFSSASKEAQLLAQQITQTQSAIEDLSKSTNNVGGSAMSSSMKFMQMRSGISAARDGVMFFTLSGQAAERSLLAMGHHINTLVNETGSMKGAFQALGSSLIGPGGIILGITVIIELFTKYQESQKKAKEETVAYIDTLSLLRQAQVKGAQDGQSEITRLAILYNAVTNTNIALADRNKAYDELSSKYPKFFTNADREKTLLGENKKAYDELTIAILSAAMAKAYEEKITSLQSRAIENGQKINDSLKEEKDLREQIAKIKPQADSQKQIQSQVIGGSSLAVNTNDNSAIDKLTGLETKLNDVLKARGNILTDNIRIRQQQRGLSERATQEEIAAGFKTNTQLDEKIKKERALWENGKPTGKIIDPANTGDGDLTKLASDADNYNKSVLSAMKAVVTNSSIRHKLTEQEINDWKKKQEAVSNYTLAANEIAGAFGQAFNSIISGSQSVAGALIGALEQIILKLIEAVIEAAAFAAIMALFTGGIGNFGSSFLSGFLGAKGSGTGGSLFSMTGFKIPGYATGGITMKPHMAMVGEGGESEVIAPLSKLKGMLGNMNGGNSTMSVEHKIKGNDLIVLINRAQKSNSRRT